MSDPIQFLVSFGQAVSTMALYNDGHPARERAVDRSYRCLRDLQQFDPNPRFSFLGEETIYGETALRQLGDWDWGTRLAQAGVQRMELAMLLHFLVHRQNRCGLIAERVGDLGDWDVSL